MLKYVRKALVLPTKSSYYKMPSRCLASNTEFSDNDEYGDLSTIGSQACLPVFELESGIKLENVTVNYCTFGNLNHSRNNAVVICHALTGNAALDSWWGALLGPGKAFDTDKYYIFCANILGSCYGTTGPTSINPSTGKPYGVTFPQVTVRDSVKLHHKVLTEVLGVHQVVSVIGGSLGGMQALEWGFFGQHFIRSLVPVACGSHHTAWQIGISELQRQAIYMDPDYQNGNYNASSPPLKGLALARQVAMVSYRTHAAYKEKYGRETNEGDQCGKFKVQSYLAYQGKKFLSRFDVNSYVRLTQLMDSHDVGRGRKGGIQGALASLTQPTLVLGIDSDVLYPVAEQMELANSLSNGKLKVISSPHGHDGFLLEQEAIGIAITKFLNEID